MSDVYLKGTDYIISGQTVTFEVMNYVSNGMLTVSWFKNGIWFEDTSKQTNPLEFTLYNAEAPAAGTYYATIFDGTGTTKTDSITLEVGTEYRTPQISVAMTKDFSASLGQTLTINPICTITPSSCSHSCSWSKDGETVSNTNSLSLNLTELSDFGTYDHLTEVQANGGYQAASLLTSINVVALSSFDVKYIHDLRPARDAGFIWIGWWVIDEINKAVKDKFDWISDPINSRFKYKDDLYTLANGFSKWNDLEIQESRNGYILNKKDVT